MKCAKCDRDVKVPANCAGVVCWSCSNEPFRIGFEVPETASADIQFIHVLGGALEFFKEVPPNQLRAALKWFELYSESKVSEFECDR